MKISKILSLFLGFIILFTSIEVLGESGYNYDFDAGHKAGIRLGKEDGKATGISDKKNNEDT